MTKNQKGTLSAKSTATVTTSLLPILCETPSGSDVPVSLSVIEIG